MILSKPYGITSELGEIDTLSHEITIGYSEATYYNSGRCFFEATSSRERFKSTRYKELALDFSSDMSTRQAAKRLNRIRLESKGTIATSYRNLVEREGSLLQSHIEEKCTEELTRNGFTPNGELQEGTELNISEPSYIPQPAIEDAAIKLNIWDYDTSDYELPEETVNVSIDDVCVKRQTQTRPRDKEKEQPKRVDNTVLHIESSKKTYILNALSLMDGIKLLIGFLLYNGLIGKQIVIFADGAKTIHSAVLKMLHFANCKIILDWYHLEKKCKELLSMALTGSKVRNEFLSLLLPCLWLGDVDSALLKLQNIDAKKVKNHDCINQLTEYLRRVKTYIPCYALRKELGLRNSSNMGEKANDIVVANRQKHNGMSWSNQGSAAFASIAAANFNHEIMRWVQLRSINFRLVHDTDCNLIAS